jgi:8-oxo-dGTP pyrophosphatase MutT (NUDIX family)
MPEDDRLLTDLAGTGPQPQAYALSTVVYAERGDEILLLQRAEGSALAGEWFLPGGMVERDEDPEAGARRELFEESGLEIDGELEMVSCYRMFIYGHDVLQLSFRGKVAERDVEISHEHTGARWVKASDMRALLTDDVISNIARGDDRVITLLQRIRIDLDRYLARVKPLGS